MMTLTRMSRQNRSINGVSHSGFFPVSSLSRKVRLKPGLMSPISEETVVVSTTKATAVPEPLRRSLA